MGRGMARHRQMGGGVKYDLKGVQSGSIVVALLDMKYYRRELGTRQGTIERRTAGRVWVRWEDDSLEEFQESDARFWVDTDRWRISPPPSKGSIFSNNMRSKPKT